ncbi:MAG: AAA family ATPase [Anaerococcus vaginalis]|uniref:AAA family ATPase n=1 Tax=Anaerococcus vaginalis TaxID=33037 RepID=UPI00290DEDD8|nr:AAA family ATPase [Anaerococcus vaginalis]MDU4446987.1 AAA family ATPase [Anaerococcus vaginalis]MDU6182633.1 AAA family ATPase [Anaerococcus vaginalis]MDU7433113.1 AAA family ATPase [Anaerococcus vaginalis]
MVNRIIIFKGSKKDFEKLLSEIIGNGSYTPFMELIQKYNARLRPNESGVREQELGRKIPVETCVVKADDYASVLPHVLSNFSTIITLNCNIDCLLVHNPPRRVEESLKAYDESIIEYKFSEYQEISRKKLKAIYEKLNKDILGQVDCKKSIITGLYRLLKEQVNNPVVLMFYGYSGVGKTESAKSISNSLGGNLLRIQFSMMQTNEAYNYVFGSEHSNNSLAKDMLLRESNVILIDEFDKVDYRFYNAFYELFDEGRYVDTNYDVDLKNTIFICTSNFMNEEKIKESLGPAMFSRFSECIQFDQLEKEHKIEIVNNWYNEVLSKLDDDEKNIIKKTDIMQWFMDNVDRYDNIRILKTKLENAIYHKLSDVYIFS